MAIKEDDLIDPAMTSSEMMKNMATKIQMARNDAEQAAAIQQLARIVAMAHSSIGILEEAVAQIQKIVMPIDNTKNGLSITTNSGITIKAGNSQISLKADGSVVISGTKVHVTGTGDVVIKGSKVTQN